MWCLQVVYRWFVCGGLQVVCMWWFTVVGYSMWWFTGSVYVVVYR